MLKKELKKHPWSQPLQMLYAKALKKLDKPGFEEAVNKAAASAPDPAAFRAILSDRAPGDGAPAERQPDTEDQSKPECHATPKGKPDNQMLSDSRHHETGKKDPDEARDLTAKPPKDLSAQLAIIDRFLEKEPRISALRDDIPEGELAPESLEEHEDMISETLADVFAKQGKTARAIDIFEKLSLKFPEKSSYFAKKMESLSKENNKTE